MSEDIDTRFCTVQTLWKLRSVLLIRQLGLANRTDVNFSVPLMRYILSSHLALPVKTVVMVERPYRTDIHPYAASAMSYDPAKNSDPTPSTTVLATDLKNRVQADWDEAEAWFRDSWMHIKTGVFLINVCCFEEFMGNSLNERVCIESFVRDMIVVSYDMSKVPVELIVLGNPAVASSNRIRGNIADRKRKLKVYRGDNPAGLRHRYGDLTSPDITVGSRELSRALYRAIVRSRNTEKCTAADFNDMTTIKQANLKAKILNAHSGFDVAIDRAAQFFKNGGKYEGPMSDEEVFVSLRSETTKFISMLVEERILIKLADFKENDAPAKGAYTPSNRGYEPKPFKSGVSSETSGISKNLPTPLRQKATFMDEDSDEDRTDTPSKAPSKAAGKAPDKSPAVKAETVSTTSSSTPAPTPGTATPVTPQRQTPQRAPPSSGRSATGSVVGSNMGSARGKPLPFIDEDSDEEKPLPILKSEKPNLDLNSEIDNLGDSKVEARRPHSPTVMTADETADMSLVGEFIHENSVNYGVAPSVIQEITEAGTTGRISSNTAAEVLSMIRDTRCGGFSSLEDELGFTSGTPNMKSPIIQFILKQSN